MKESCDIQQLGDKKASIIHSGPLVEVSPADILHGRGLSVLSSAHRMPDGIFNGVLHDVWLLPEAIQDISLENSIFNTRPLASAVVFLRAQRQTSDRDSRHTWKTSGCGERCPHTSKQP